MKKKLLAILLTVCMVLSMAPAALAAGSVFTDVNADDWFADEVEYVYDNGLMNGVGDNKFDPDSDVTRAMVWTALARLDSVNTAGSDPWWLAGQQWAMENEISDGTMATEDITREQLVTMVWRYAKYIDMDVSEGEDANILSYIDAFDVNEWAIPAMQWACAVGIINGIDGALQPQGNATRAQLAAILYRFVEKVMPEEEPVTPPVPPVIIVPHSHTWGSWVSNEDGTHTRSYTCGHSGSETKDCDGTDGVACSKCGFVVGSQAKIGDTYYPSAQAALDAAKNGDIIELFAGNHGDLVFRVTEDSELIDNTYYYMSNYESSYYGKEAWQYAKRTINGLTITGVEGAVIDSFTVAADRDDAGNAKGTRNNMFEITNLTISNLTVANSISFNTSDVTIATSETETAVVPHLKLDGLTIDNCKTTTGGDTTQGEGRKLLGIANTGSASNAKNIVVTDCVVTDMYQGVYIVDGENVRIEGNSFSGLTHNSIHINKCCSGTIIISGNTMDYVNDRPIRFSGVQSGTVAITNNTITNSEGDNGEFFKASAMDSDVTLTWENNTAAGVAIKLTPSGTDIIGTKAN